MCDVCIFGVCGHVYVKEDILFDYSDTLDSGGDDWFTLEV